MKKSSLIGLLIIVVLKICTGVDVYYVDIVDIPIDSTQGKAIQSLTQRRPVPNQQRTRSRPIVQPLRQPSRVIQQQRPTIQRQPAKQPPQRLQQPQRQQQLQQVQRRPVQQQQRPQQQTVFVAQQPQRQQQPQRRQQVQRRPAQQQQRPQQQTFIVAQQPQRQQQPQRRQQVQQAQRRPVQQQQITEPDTIIIIEELETQQTTEQQQLQNQKQAQKPLQPAVVTSPVATNRPSSQSNPILTTTVSPTPKVSPSTTAKSTVDTGDELTAASNVRFNNASNNSSSESVDPSISNQNNDISSETTKNIADNTHSSDFNNDASSTVEPAVDSNEFNSVPLDSGYRDRGENFDYFRWFSPHRPQENHYRDFSEIFNAIDQKAESDYNTSVEDDEVNDDFNGRSVVAPGQYPHMAALGYRTSTGETEFMCGGSLISEMFVLTAAHCCFLNGEAPHLVKIGDIKLKEFDDYLEPQRRGIARVIKHPYYNASMYYNDIGLLELTNPIVFTYFVRPIRLWAQDELPYDRVFTMGYGSTSFAKAPTNVLTELDLSIVSLEACNRTLPRDPQAPYGLTESQICAKDFEKNRDTCQGDSGGPLQLNLQRPRRRRMRYYLVGIISYGTFCRSEQPGVYTRVSSYIDWIASEVWPEYFDNFQ